MYSEGFGALQPPHCVLDSGQASKSSGTGSHQWKGKEEPQPWPSASPALQSLEHCPCSGDACPTGALLKSGSVLSVWAQSELPWTSDTLGSHVTENSTWILLPLWKDVCLVSPSSSSCSELTVTIISQGAWAGSQGWGAVWKSFLTHSHTQQPKSGRTQHRTPLT